MAKKKITVTTTVTEEIVDTPSVAKTDNARLIFVLDRSGSMGGIANEAIGGFNAFVEGQKKEPGKATISLVIFDHEIVTVHDKVNLKEVEALTDKVYQARGMTALYDAIGVTITKYLGEKSKKNEKTILAILTDGEENSSKEYSGKAVADLIKSAETEHGWEVLFLGANIDVSKVATQLNIGAHKFATFAATSKGMGDTYGALNSVTSMYRSAAAMGCVMDAEDVNLENAYVAAAAASSN